MIILGRTQSTLETAAKEISDAAKSVNHQVNVRFFIADVTDADVVFNTFKTIKGDCASIDIVVNNAGGLHLGTIEDSDAAGYISSFDANFKGTLNIMQSFSRLGLDRDSASPATFINLSTLGIAMPNYPTWSQYVTSKLAAFSLTAFMGVEMKGKVRAFSIHPGRIATDMSTQAGLQASDDEGSSYTSCSPSRREADRYYRATWCVLCVAHRYTRSRLSTGKTSGVQLGCR